jgi:hypothetical protein
MEQTTDKQLTNAPNRRPPLTECRHKLLTTHTLLNLLKVKYQ